MEQKHPTRSKKKHVFKKSKAEIFVYRYGIIICWIVFVLLFFCEFIVTNSFNYILFFGLPWMIFWTVVFYIFVRKHVYQLIFDEEKNSITIFMYLKIEPYKIGYEEISKIKMGYFVRIYFHNKFVKFKGYSEDVVAIVEYLNKTPFNLEWTWWGRFNYKTMFHTRWINPFKV